MIVSVSGTTSKKLIDYIQRVAEYLRLDDYDTFIELNIQKKCDSDAGGYAHGDDNDVSIEIARTCMGEKYSRKEIMINIAHEMIHAQQLASGRLYNKGFVFKKINSKEKCLAYAYEWEGETYIDTPYDEQPWEIEAYTMEKEVYDICS
jgi:hypothetical protein